MKDLNQRVQLPLFARESPAWSSVPCHAQQLVTEVLSQMVRDAIDNGRDSSTTQTTTADEDVHVS